MSLKIRKHYNTASKIKDHVHTKTIGRETRKENNSLT